MNLKTSQFRALCALTAFALYGRMVVSVARYCGVPGVIVVGVVTILYTLFTAM